ncbi:hypothetical protein FF38_06283 [Lucilia cuprina]|uniref:Uncharacterized protein n=1 Tax=Lucilia cuprina TaxID=7375 RepID=A0A0L0CLV7_LUCCU|nr:hypothetical protein FF38_06283 [Lucilia cuprina]
MTSVMVISGKLELTISVREHEGNRPVIFSTTYAQIFNLKLGSIGEPIVRTHIVEEFPAKQSIIPVTFIDGTENVGIASFLCNLLEIKVPCEPQLALLLYI